MKNKIWMVAMMLIAFLVGMMSSQNTAAQQGEIGRYQIEKIDDSTIFVWKIDTATGNLWKCQLATRALPELISGCGRAIR